MSIQIVTEGEDIEQKCCQSNCPLWNYDRDYCQHPNHGFPKNVWSPANDPFDTCPLKIEPITIQLNEE